MLLYTTAQIYRSPSRFDSVNAIAWSPTGTRLAGGYEEGTVRVWDTTTGRQALFYQGHSEPIYEVVWSPDGSFIASAGEDHNVQVWEASTGKTCLTYSGHSAAVGALAWSPDGRCIASGDFHSERTIQVWLATTGTCLWSHRGSASPVEIVAWSPDSTYLAAGFDNGCIKVWDIRTGECVRFYEDHALGESNNDEIEIQGLAWSPDGTRMASGAKNRTLQVWEIATGQILFTAPFAHGSISWSPDGALLAGTTHGKDGKLRIAVWDAQTGQQVFTHRYWSESYALAYSPDGTRLAVGDFASNKIRILEEIHQQLHPLQSLWLRLRG